MVGSDNNNNSKKPSDWGTFWADLVLFMANSGGNYSIPHTILSRSTNTLVTVQAPGANRRGVTTQGADTIALNEISPERKACKPI